MKKIIAILLAAIMLCGLLAGCGETTTKPATGEDKGSVGILMPTKEQSIWSVQGNRLTTAFQEAGYKVEIEYAEDDPAKQVMQIENMITKGVRLMVIVAVDGGALTDACEKAKAAGIYVIAEDRLITDTEAVDFYVTFDLVKMGELQGQYIADQLGLAEGKGPFNLEIFSGSQDDPNALLFYDGAMGILQQYLDNGQLVVQSGQQTYDQTAIQSWDTEKAHQRMDNILSGFYGDKHLDAVLVAADCLTMGVIPSLESAGSGTEANPFPITTGQDAELAAIHYIKEGKQSMTAFLDAQKLSDILIPVAEQLMNGEEIKDTVTYNNNVIDVPAKTYDPLLIDKNNYNYLAEVGFYTEAEING
ncbi:MAG: sugar-binding protein [Oscillospiraceae bacterium]|nr:sugar-binding protein [Oscillospiraceae bacterium]